MKCPITTAKEYFTELVVVALQIVEEKVEPNIVAVWNRREQYMLEKLTEKKENKEKKDDPKKKDDLKKNEKIKNDFFSIQSSLVLECCRQIEAMVDISHTKFTFTFTSLYSMLLSILETVPNLCSYFRKR